MNFLTAYRETIAGAQEKCASYLQRDWFCIYLPYWQAAMERNKMKWNNAGPTRMAVGRCGSTCANGHQPGAYPNIPPSAAKNITRFLQSAYKIPPLLGKCAACLIIFYLGQS
jgi:hypothetical protein